MEGGNKTNINLYAGIDTSTSDMLVPINGHTFQHNWQKFQGKFLPNSLRFEKNGWAAGWNVYNFVYNSTRVKLAENVYAELSLYGQYAKSITIYDSMTSDKALAVYYVVTDAKLIAGNAELDGYTITGELEGERYSLVWDPVTHTLSNDNPLFVVEQKIDSNKTVQVKVSRTDSLSVDFDLFINCMLTGDALSDIAFRNQTASNATWGSFIYDFASNKILTPEGVVADCVRNGNEIQFEYDKTVTDEDLSLRLFIEPTYFRFTNVRLASVASDHLTSTTAVSSVGFNKFDFSLDCKTKVGYYYHYGNKALIFTQSQVRTSVSSSTPQNWYDALPHSEEVRWSNWDSYVAGHPEYKWVYVLPSSKVTDSGSYTYYFQIQGDDTPENVITAGDTTGVPISCKVPVWVSMRVNWDPIELTAKWANNTLYNEVAVYAGTGLNVQVTCINAFNGSRVTKNLTDVYSANGTKPQYITGLDYRFNQLLVHNTIKPSADWSPMRYNVNKSDIWILDEKQYSNFRNRNKDVISKLFGDLYELRDFTFKASDYIEQNNPFDWTVADNIVYTEPNISDIPSIKPTGAEDITDAAFTDSDILSNIIPPVSELYDRYVAHLTDSTPAIYNNITVLAKVYDDLYDATGKYIGGTYTVVPLDVVDPEQSFWPFKFVPQFKFRDSNGNIHNRVYWTDGTEIITDITVFLQKVLGDYNGNLSKDNQVVTPNEGYSRIRNVQTYIAAYDFDKPTDILDITKFNNAWDKYYPGISSPIEQFFDTDMASDDRYLNYTDIVVQTVKPTVKYITPGVYVSGKFALPFMTSANIIMYNNVGLYSGSTQVFHQNIDVTDRYNISIAHTTGKLSFNGVEAVLPYYFGSLSKVTLYSSDSSVDVFRQATASADVTSDTITITATEMAENTWLRKYTGTYKAGKFTGTPEGLRLYNTITTQSKFDMIDGLFIAICGNALTKSKVTYPVAKGKSQLNEEDTLRIEPVLDESVSSNLKQYVWVDRDSINAYSMLLYSIAADSIDVSVNDKNVATAELKLVVKTESDSVLYYTEDTGKLYFPGCLFNDDTPEGITVLQDSTKSSQVTIEAAPQAYNVITDVTPIYNPVNTYQSGHIFYREYADTLSLAVEIDPMTGGYDERFRVRFNNSVISFSYNINTKVLSVADITGPVIYNEFCQFRATTTLTGSDSDYNLKTELKLFFNNCKAKFNYIPDATYNITAADTQKLTVNVSDVDLVYNYTTLRVISPKVIQKVDLLEDRQHITANRDVSTLLTAAMPAVYDGSIDGSIARFVFDGTEYSIDFSGIVINNNMSVTSTDIRTPDKTKVIGSINVTGQYQMLRQAWNTTIEVENYWYVDPTHILELGLSTFKLKRNTGKLDDWNGNVFEDVYEVERSSVLTTDIIKYFVPSVCDSTRSSVFCTLQTVADDIVISMYDIRDRLKLISSFNVSVVQKQIGQQLNTQDFNGNNVFFNTYGVLTGSIILSTAEWSSTIIGDYLIIGCHMNNNLDQWVFVVDLTTNTVIQVLQGYGFVGLHGELTGGMIPDDYFNTQVGFTGTVQSLDSLNSNAMDVDNLDAAFEVNSIQELSYIAPKIVGTAERQWYIQSELSGIVSHLTFNNGMFTKHTIPLTNRYTSVYKSGSFSSSILGDCMVQAQSIESTVKFQAGSALDVTWKIVMGAAGWPMIYHLSPRYSMLNYLQQTLGQYAYVHYNSSESIEDNVQDDYNDDVMKDAQGSGVKKVKKQADPVLSGTMTFGKQKVSQTLASNFNFVSAGLVAVTIITLAESLTELGNTLTSVNAEQNQTSVNDIAKKYLPLAAENTSDMIASSITTTSKSNNSMTSVVTGIKTLDMFYSTSDKQRVFAGPGFVEHQFVADCIAQSVTDMHVDGKVQQLFWCIKGLTTYQLDLALRTELAAADALQTKANTAAPAGGNSFGGQLAAAAAIAMSVSASVLYAAAVATEAAAKVLNDFMDTLCAQGVKSTVDAVVHNQNMTAEATHKYGEKNEVFMWPCWGIQPGSLKYADELITSGVKNTPWMLNLVSRQFYTAQALNAFSPIMSLKIPKLSSNLATTEFMTKNIGYGKYFTSYADDSGEIGDNFRAYMHRGSVPYYQAAVYSEVDYKTLPDDMAKVEGVERLLPNQPFRNDNCGAGDPVFAPSMIQDYIVDKRWDLSQTCSYGLSQWVTVKDTKLTNCAPSNMYVTDDFCGIACPYTAIEVKRGISKTYMRPWAVTPNTLAFNTTGYNSIFDNKLYHAFDGITYRLIDLVGTAGLNKNFQSFWYLFQNNDAFKRSNIAPANEILGNFNAEPTHAVSTIDPLFCQLNIGVKEKYNKTGTASEDRDTTRWAIPLFTEPVSTLPAVVKTIASSALAVVDGVTGLVTKLITDTNADYKAPLSIDFTINKTVYRATEEYICKVTPSNAGNTYEDIVPILGLMFIGATPTEAYFYSKATRYYYTFTGNSLTKVDMLERFRDIQRGYWDFVNQEVVMPCLMTFKRLNPDVKDKDTETDNIIIPVLQNSTVSGELPPPLTTIFNDRSWYKAVSLPSGFAYQGPNRVIINRSVLVEYMTDSIKKNMGSWGKLNKEKFTSARKYPEQYKDVVTDVHGVDGWTYNPFVLVTSPLGMAEDTDGLFEWAITFCWPIEMDLLYGTDNYAVVNIAADTMSVGSKVEGRPTHVYLTKELFARSDSYGYYTFTYQSRNGEGNRERLKIWSDQYIAISSIDCTFKPVTTKRATVLTQQVDIQKLKEL